MTTATRTLAALLPCVVMLLATEATAQTTNEPPTTAEDPDDSGKEATEDAPRGEITKLPKLVSTVEATYPDAAIEKQLEASVVLEIDIDATGKIEDVRVAQPSGHDGLGFEEAAVDAVKQFVFEPAEIDGVVAPVTFAYRYNFVFRAPEPEVSETEEAPADPEVAEPEAKPPVNFAGLLRERGTRDRLAGILVTVFREAGEPSKKESPEGYEAWTDDEGQFSFAGLAPGLWKVHVEAEGYYTVDTREEVFPNQMTDVVYYVERKSYNPFDVLVEQERVKKEVTRRKLAAAEIEAVPGTYGDPLGVVQNLPGVARSSFGDGTLVVRGASPEDTGIMVSGFRVRAFDHFGGIRSIFPLQMIDSINFYPGNAPIEYGRLTGGVLEVEPKKLRSDAVHGFADVNLFDAGAYTEAPITKDLSIAVSARRSYIDAVLDAALPDDAGLSFRTAPRYYDAHVLASYRPDPAHELRLYSFVSDDELEILFDNSRDIDPQFDAANLEAGLEMRHAAVYWDFTPTTSFHNEVKLGVTNGESITHLGAERRIDIYWTNMFAREMAEVEVNDHVSFRLGLDAELAFLRTDVLMSLPPKEGEFADIYRDEDALNYYANREWSLGSGAFADVTVKPVEAWSITPGVRGDIQHFIGEPTVDPRIHSRVDINDAWAVKGGVGVFHQAPSLDETVEGFGNPDIGPERAIHYSLGTEIKPLDFLTLDFTGFYNDLDNLVARTEATTVRGGEVVPLRFDNVGEGRVFGLETMVRHEFAHNFTGWISYTLSRSERKDFAGDEYRLFDWDQTHILTLVGAYKLPWNMELSARFRYTTGNPTTPIVGSTFVSDKDTFAPVPGAINSDRVDAFHQLDLRLDKKFIFDVWTLDAYVDVQNVYNHGNPEAVTYNFDYTEQTAVTGLPILPSIGLKAEF